MNYIEQLLAKIEDQEARTQFSELATKHQILNDWIIDPEVTEKVKNIQQWADTEWDYEHGMSKLEYRQSQELEQLTNKLSTQAQEFEDNKGKGVMELTELDAHLGKFMKDNGLMTKTEYEAGIKAKEDQFNAQLGIVSTLATRIPFLNAKYQKDFGEQFDPDEFVKQADEKGYAKFGAKGLDEYYKEFTAEKQTAKQAADQAALEAAAERRGYEKANQERLAALNNGSGAGPDVGGSPEMGHFEARVKGMSQFDNKADKVPAELPLGQTAKYAAAIADRKDREAGLVQ